MHEDARTPFLNALTREDIRELAGISDPKERIVRARAINDALVDTNGTFITDTFRILRHQTEEPGWALIDCILVGPTGRVMHYWRTSRSEHYRAGEGNVRDSRLPSYGMLASRMLHYEAKDGSVGACLITPPEEATVFCRHEEAEEVSEILGVNGYGMVDVCRFHVKTGLLDRLPFEKPPRPAGGKRPPKGYGSRKTRRFVLGRIGTAPLIEGRVAATPGFSTEERDGELVKVYRPYVWIDHPTAGRVFGAFKKRGETILEGGLPRDELPDNERSYRLEIPRMWLSDGSEATTYRRALEAYVQDPSLNAWPLLLYNTVSVKKWYDDELVIPGFHNNVR